MKHRLAITKAQATLVGKVLDATGEGLTWASEVDPGDPEYIIITEITERIPPTAAFSRISIQEDRYVCTQRPCRTGKVDAVIESDSVEAVLAAVRWVLCHGYNKQMADLLTASLMLAIRSEAFISHSDETDSSIDSGDMVDVMYGAVRAINPMYKKE